MTTGVEAGGGHSRPNLKATAKLDMGVLAVTQADIANLDGSYLDRGALRNYTRKLRAEGTPYPVSAAGHAHTSIRRGFMDWSRIIFNEAVDQGWERHSYIAQRQRAAWEHAGLTMVYLEYRGENYRPDSFVLGKDEEESVRIRALGPTFDSLIPAIREHKLFALYGFGILSESVVIQYLNQSHDLAEPLQPAPADQAHQITYEFGLGFKATQ